MIADTLIFLIFSGPAFSENKFGNAGFAFDGERLTRASCGGIVCIGSLTLDTCRSLLGLFAGEGGSFFVVAVCNFATFDLDCLNVFVSALS